MANRVYVMGDIHGDCRHIRDFYLRNKIKFNKSNKNFDGTDTMILLGDAGLNYFLNERDNRTKEKMGKYPFIYFIIRGNHEERPSICMEKNPENWHTEKYFGNTVYVENKYPHIKYALDDVNFYDIPYMVDYVSPENPTDDDIEIIKTYRTLVIPGAYSVDKYHRLEMGWSWFPHEQLTKEEMEEGLNLIKRNNFKCDLVLSHTCPVIYEPTDLFLSIVDQSMVEKDMERYLGQIEYQLNYKVHLWGHYHQYREYPRNIGEPTINNPRQLMLFNDAVVELEDVMTNKNLVNRL